MCLGVGAGMIFLVDQVQVFVDRDPFSYKYSWSEKHEIESIWRACWNWSHYTLLTLDAAACVIHLKTGAKEWVTEAASMLVPAWDLWSWSQQFGGSVMAEVGAKAE